MQLTDEQRADLTRAAIYLASNNDDDSSIDAADAERIAATLRDLAVVHPRRERWIVALETAVQIPGARRPTLGYTVFADAEPFDSFEAASAFIKTHKLPLGWVAMQDTHNPWPALFPAGVASGDGGQR